MVHECAPDSVYGFAHLTIHPLAYTKLQDKYIKGAVEYRHHHGWFLQRPHLLSITHHTTAHYHIKHE